METAKETQSSSLLSEMSCMFRAELIARNIHLVTMQLVYLDWDLWWNPHIVPGPDFLKMLSVHYLACFLSLGQDKPSTAAGSGFITLENQYLGSKRHPHWLTLLVPTGGVLTGDPLISSAMLPLSMGPWREIEETITNKNRIFQKSPF